MTVHKVGYLIGSLSAASINRKLAKALIKLAPDNLEFHEIEIKDLPLYNHDLDDNYPAPAQALKHALADVDALLFVTPEYNRSIPGGLKNAIDWGSRPWGDNSFSRKPSAVIGASIGNIGTAVAQQQLRSVLGYCDSPQMNFPEGYIHFTEDLVTDDGEVTNDNTRAFLTDYLERYAEFVTRVRAVIPPDED
ncbi:MAG: NAD(P)H-dependent oxidoreductase [Nocardioides sp.]|nr:NAD(P)H-dependent oxidoreductase [Nocardioides sp.]